MRNYALAVLLLCGGGAAAQPPARKLVARPIPVKGQPSHLLVHQDKLFVGCFQGSTFTVIDRNTRKALSAHAYQPGDAIVANGKVFLGPAFSEQVVVFDLKTMKVLTRLPLVGDGCFAATADGKTVYYATSSKNEFHIIDTNTYRIKTVPYPAGGRGIGHSSIALGPDGNRLYLGIQRGGKGPGGVELSGGNSFLAVYDLRQNAYAGTVYLAQTNQLGGCDDSIPAGMAFSPDGRLLYVGMMQSLAGIQVVDTATLRRVDNISFEVGPKNAHFKWVDPLGVAVYRRWLLSVNRNNNELVVVDRANAKAVARLSFADDKQPMRTIAVRDDLIYLGGNNRVHELNGRRLARLIERALRDGKTKAPVEVTLTTR